MSVSGIRTIVQAHIKTAIRRDTGGERFDRLTELLRRSYRATTKETLILIYNEINYPKEKSEMFDIQAEAHIMPDVYLTVCVEHVDDESWKPTLSRRLLTMFNSGKLGPSPLFLEVDKYVGGEHMCGLGTFTIRPNVSIDMSPALAPATPS